MKEWKKNLQKNKWLVLVMVCLLCVLMGGCYHWVTHVRLEQAFEQEAAQSAPVQTHAPTPKPTPEPTPEPTPLILPEGFIQAKEQNEDVYAWIEITDTEVAYPILRHPSDDGYYLSHTIDHVASLPGSIYTESVDAKDFSDFNTVIYGHNMANDTMFGSLSKYRDEKGYAADHREIIVYTETEKRVYTVCAAVVYDDRYIPEWYDDTKEEGRQGFLDSVYGAKGAINIKFNDVAVDTQSQLITLSTCIGGMPHNRYLLVAVYTGE